MESPHGDPTTPGVAPAPACACPTSWADEVHRAWQIGRKTGRQGGREDSPTHRAEQAARGHLLTLPAMPACLALPCLPSPISHHAHLPCLPTFPALPAYPAHLPCPVSRLSCVCHIVNASVTRAPLKTAFCQAILLFSNLSKRYALIHNNLRDN